MSELQVPDFNTLDDFKNWVVKLEDKEIQSWTTKDWLKVYEKIDAYVESPDFDRIYREKLPKLVKDGVFSGTVEELANPTNLNISALKRRAFIKSDQVTRNLLGNLYSNYRFEPEQLEIIRKLGKNAGTQLAEKGIGATSIAIPTKNSTNTALYDVMHSANNITINQTNYQQFGWDYKNYFSVGIDDEMAARGEARRLLSGNNELIINSKRVADEGIHVSFHEAAHLHMQNGGIGQREGMSKHGIRAVDMLDEDFYKLMEKNQDYYISPRTQDEINELYSALEVCDEKTARKIRVRDYNRYHKQPIERYSEIYGIEAERAYRQTSGRLTERTAMKVADYIAGTEGMPPLSDGTITNIGRPEEVKYTEKGIELTYKSYDTEPEKLEKAIKAKFARADEKILQDMNIKTSKLFGEVKLTIPNSYDFTSRYNKFAATPPPPPIINTAATVPPPLPENMQTAPHHFPSVADMKGMEKIDLYHGSRNFFEKYDLTKARTIGGAQYGLGQYFTTKESMAYSYATLIKENPFIEKNVETNGEKVATQKVVYHGEIKGEDLSHILVPEKMSDLDYDVLIKTAEKQGKSDIAAELTKIKATSVDRHIDLCQWLRKTENVQFMQSAGINGIYSPDREIYAIYDTSKMNIKVKEAVVLSGTEIPKNLIADKSIIHIQETLVDKAESAHILTTEGHALQKDGTSGGKTIIATAEKSAEKQAEQTVTSATEKAATKSAMKATAVQAGAKVAKTAKTAGKVTKETLLAVNKAYDDTFDAIMKWGDKHAPQWMNKVEEKTVQKAAEKFMKTKSGQAIAKQIEKKVGKEVAASIAKKIPILCLGVGAVCVYDRVKEGEYLKAVGEGASALVANVPGLGTLASFGLDGAMLSDDLKVFEHGVIPKDPNSHMAAESTFVAQQIVAEKKFVRKVDKAAEAKKKVEEEKKKAESKKKAQEFEKNLYKYGRKQADFFDR